MLSATRCEGREGVAGSWRIIDNPRLSGRQGLFQAAARVCDESENPSRIQRDNRYLQLR
jgi:hypothetical protein